MLWPLFALIPLAAPAQDAVRDGRPVAVEVEGEPWTSADGWLTGQGTGTLLWLDGAVGAGDFHLRAELRIDNLARSAASVRIGGSDFGFEGADGEAFASGRVLNPKGGLLRLGPVPVREGEPFVFELTREGDRLRLLVDGSVVHEVALRRGPLGFVGFRPWRSTMRLREMTVTGDRLDVDRPSAPRGYTIPTRDLSADPGRQVIVDEERDQYLGHPTTTLLADGRTMLCVYPKGHGRGAIVYKRSTDGGLTWSERLPTPDNWATSLETPTIHRMVDPQGVERLILFSGLYPIRRAVSEDDGHTWTPLEPIGDFGGIVAMSSVLRLADGRWMALFHDDGRFLAGDGPPDGLTVYKTLSSDGGLTWGPPEPVTSHPLAHLCEPGAVRSPDGRRLALLLRENSRQYNSMVVFSDDEGATWTAPRELPGSLTGDRHVAAYAPDGRLVVVFRDTTHESPTKGDFVAWVGRWEDIAEGREGEYRARLIDAETKGDLGYAGLEVLPDGTFVATTYAGIRPGQPPCIVSVRFRP